MITNAPVSAVLATGTALIYDLVTLTINRGRCWQFDGGGLNPVRKDIVDSVRWTDAPRALRANVGGSAQVFQPVTGMAYQRGTLSSKAGAEVLQVGFSVAGTLPISLSTAQDGSGSFATTLMELALLGMLDGATLTIDQVVCSDLPSTPVSAGAGYGIVSPDPVRVFSGVLRGAKPSGYAVEFDACDPLILGGGSVPRGVFSPLCRWEFAGGGGCPVQRRMDGTSAKTQFSGAGSSISFPDSSHLLFSAVPPNVQWAFLVPQDGPMMGMRFQIGNQISSLQYEFADRLPWTWSCSVFQIEFGCSKAYSSPGWAAGIASGSCQEWDAWLKGSLVSSGTLPSFGGFPDMPQPESA